MRTSERSRYRFITNRESPLPTYYSGRRMSARKPLHFAELVRNLLLMYIYVPVSESCRRVYVCLNNHYRQNQLAVQFLVKDTRFDYLIYKSAISATLYETKLGIYKLHLISFHLISFISSINCIHIHKEKERKKKKDFVSKNFPQKKA